MLYYVYVFKIYFLTRHSFDSANIRLTYEQVLVLYKPKGKIWCGKLCGSRLYDDDDSSRDSGAKKKENKLH